MEIPLWMFYPTFETHEERGIFPNVNLPANYRELVKPFYNLGKKKAIEAYAKRVQEIFKPQMPGLEIRLQWDDEEGLTNISLGASPGFDLDTNGFPHFREHNLGMVNSFIAGAIAQKYISVLLKSE